MVGDVLVVGGSRGHALTRRVVSVMVAVAMLGALLLVVADRAEASPSSVAVASVVAPESAQFGISQIVCPILLFLRAAFGPFFSGIFDSLLAAFGCINVSPGGPPDDDDDD